MYDRDFHKSIENDETPQAIRLAEYIKEHLSPTCFFDFGCSTGTYLYQIKKHLPNIISVGFEFSDEAVQHAVCSDIIQHDLTTPLTISKSPRTLGLCLEVLEHIEDIHWKSVLENITKNCDRVIFSAAVPGQGGVGHINCRLKIVWIKRFHELGWVVDLDGTNHLLNYMKNGYHMGWFANNAMVLIPYAN
jgi:hypothetical protein